ncbi:hypothetical protein HYQ46_008629 [Verticillium longisporum]|nr:hypothetical protein HYQ46_008629 [Verticillium longisporum]
MRQLTQNHCLSLGISWFAASFFDVSAGHKTRRSAMAMMSRSGKLTTARMSRCAVMRQLTQNHCLSLGIN